MKKLLGHILKISFLMTMLQASAFANYQISEHWSEDLRSQIKVECGSYTNVCKQLCNNTKICILKNSTCKDCISTGVKMTYLFSSFGKDINTDSKEEVSVYELVDFLRDQSFIAFSAYNIYNQLDSVQSNALAKSFQAMCPNNFDAPMAFFKIDKRILEIGNAKFITCGDSIYKLEVNSPLLTEQMRLK